MSTAVTRLFVLLRAFLSKNLAEIVGNYLGLCSNRSPLVVLLVSLTENNRTKALGEELSDLIWNSKYIDADGLRSIFTDITRCRNFLQREVNDANISTLFVKGCVGRLDDILFVQNDQNDQKKRSRRRIRRRRRDLADFATRLNTLIKFQPVLECPFRRFFMATYLDCGQKENTFVLGSGRDKCTIVSNIINGYLCLSEGSDINNIFANIQRSLDHFQI